MLICLILIAEIGITFSCLRLGVILITKDLAFVHTFYFSHKANFNRRRLFAVGNVCAQSLSHIRLFVTLWTIARQSPLSMEFSRQELEWVAIPFCRGASWSKDRTWISCIAGRFFTIWAIREVHPQEVTGAIFPGDRLPDLNMWSHQQLKGMVMPHCT